MSENTPETIYYSVKDGVLYFYDLPIAEVADGAQTHLYELELERVAAFATAWQSHLVEASLSRPSEDQSSTVPSVEGVENTSQRDPSCTETTG